MMSRFVRSEDTPCVGAAQQLTRNGVQLLPIMRAGGWRSVNVVAQYIENVDINVWRSHS